MGVIKIKSLFLLIACFFLIACSTVVDNYNSSLLSYEAKIEFCNEKRKESLTGSRPKISDDKIIRLALSYFIVKSFEDCVKAEKQELKLALDQVVNDQGVAELIRFNANSLLKSFSDDKLMLEKEKKKFLSLPHQVQDQLTEIQAYNRPFDPLMAIEYYLNEAD